MEQIPSLGNKRSILSTDMVDTTNYNLMETVIYIIITCINLSELNYFSCENIKKTSMTRWLLVFSPLFSATNLYPFVSLLKSHCFILFFFIAQELMPILIRFLGQFIEFLTSRISKFCLILHLISLNSAFMKSNLMTWCHFPFIQFIIPNCISNLSPQNQSNIVQLDAQNLETLVRDYIIKPGNKYPKL